MGWIDGQAQSWVTKRDFDQEGSYLQILGIEDGHRTDGKYFVKVLSRIKCNVYRESTDEKRILDVEVVSHFDRIHRNETG